MIVRPSILMLIIFLLFSGCDKAVTQCQSCTDGSLLESVESKRFTYLNNTYFELNSNLSIISQPFIPCAEDPTQIDEDIYSRVLSISGNIYQLCDDSLNNYPSLRFLEVIEREIVDICLPEIDIIDGLRTLQGIWYIQSISTHEEQVFPPCEAGDPSVEFSNNTENGDHTYLMVMNMISASYVNYYEVDDEVIRIYEYPYQTTVAPNTQRARDFNLLYINTLKQSMHQNQPVNFLIENNFMQLQFSNNNIFHFYQL